MKDWVYGGLLAVALLMLFLFLGLGCSGDTTYIISPAIIENPGQNGCPNQSGRCDTIQVFMGDSRFWEHSQHGR